MTECTTLKPKEYLSGIKPIWCPGCGDYAVLNSLTKAFSALDLQRKDTAIISGIGCSSRLPMYANVYGFHTIHGRALPAATGLKVARDDLTVLAVGGDGDGFSIGGNHFVHSCRRNVDVTYVVMDNAVYGMTKGQASPTTESDWTGSNLTPEGPNVPPFEPLRMALASGATFVARGFAGKPKHLTELIKAGIEHKGFSMIQVISPCITWRPEDMNLKKLVHEGFGDTVTDDQRTARQYLLDDDGYTIGTLYQKKGQVPYRKSNNPSMTLDELETQFAL